VYALKKVNGQWELWVWSVYGAETTYPEVYGLETPEPKEEFFRGAIVIRDPEAGKTYVVRTRYDGCDNSFTNVEVVDDPAYTPGAVPCPTV